MGLRNNNILSLLEVKTEDYGERVALGMKNSFGWKEFTYKGIGLLYNGIKNIYELPNNYSAKWRLRNPKSTALIIYTSGTTGAPLDVEVGKFFERIGIRVYQGIRLI